MDSPEFGPEIEGAEDFEAPVTGNTEIEQPVEAEATALSIDNIAAHFGYVETPAMLEAPDIDRYMELWQESIEGLSPENQKIAQLGSELHFAAKYYHEGAGEDALKKLEIALDIAYELGRQDFDDLIRPIAQGIEDVVDPLPNQGDGDETSS